MLYPMAAMVLLIFIVGCVTLKVRINSVKSKQISLKYFQLMQGDNLPDMVVKTNRHLANLFENPSTVLCGVYLIRQPTYRQHLWLSGGLVICTIPLLAQLYSSRF